MDTDDLAGARVRECDLNRVERETMETKLLSKAAVVLAVPMLHVPDNRAAEVAQMSTDLMRPPRQRLSLHPRIALPKHSEATKAGLRRSALVAFLSRNRMVDEAFYFRDASYQRQVALMDLLRRECSLNRRHIFALKRKDKRTTGRSIQAMDRVDMLTDQVAHEGHRVERLARPSAMNRQTSRLVDDDQGIVTKQDVWWRRFARGDRGHAQAGAPPQPYPQRWPQGAPSRWDEQPSRRAPLRPERRA